MNKIQLSHRMYSISDIQRLMQSDELVLQPKYQRRRTAWPITAKTGLIDTIANNYPIQPIYLREYTTQSKNRIKEIIDGQQRITTIIEFLDNKYPLYTNFLDGDYNNYKYKDLPFEMQQLILDYELSFMSIKNASDSDIISIFSRINSYTLPLNKQEKRNALYAGEFKSLVYKISANYQQFWNDFKIFTDAGIARMKDAELVSELITILLIGFKEYIPKEVDRIYKKYDDSFSNQEYYYTCFNTILSIIGNLFNNSKVQNHFKKQSWFFSLFLAIYHKYYGEILPNKTYSAKNVIIEKLSIQVEKMIDDYKSENLDDSIKLLFQQGTSYTSNRIKRHEFILNYIS